MMTHIVESFPLIKLADDAPLQLYSADVSLIRDVTMKALTK